MTRDRGGRGNSGNAGRDWQHSWPQRSQNNRNYATSEHDARYSFNEECDNYKGTFLTQIMRVNNDKTRYVVSYNSNMNKIDWCTGHAINDESYFNEPINLESAINVKVGDGRGLTGAKVRNLYLKFLLKVEKLN